jgi:hypothetical protein
MHPFVFGRGDHFHGGLNGADLEQDLIDRDPIWRATKIRNKTGKIGINYVNIYTFVFSEF